MKKIIMLITMFVLSVGFLMAQGVFNYQAVVVDDQGNLVVDQDVNAKVTIIYLAETHDQAIYVQTINGIHTSLNGLAMLPIGNPDDPSFMAIDWRTATIKVQFTPVEGDVTIPQAEYERVAGVPYALQAGGDDALTTEMIADYYGRATTTMDDMEAIFAALESNEPLANHMKRAFIDTVKNNRHVAKQILLHYLNTGTTDDVQALYNAFDGNSEVKAAVTQIVKQLIQTHREEVYAILRDYALHLTSAEVNDIFDAFPNDVKQEIVTRAANYVKDPNHKSTLIIPIFMDYVTNITVAEFNELVDALIDNVPVYNVMLNQFNAWMDEYFENHFTGGSNVEEIVSNTIEEGYYAQCEDEPVDLCQLKADIESLAVCFELTTPLQFTFNKLETGEITYTLSYVGTADPTSVELRVATGNDNPQPVDGGFTIDTDANTITVTLDPDHYDYVPGDTLSAQLIITVSCLEAPVNAWGTYYEQ